MLAQEGEVEQPERRPEIATGQLLLERYRIKELIAEGGHSLVYRVEDERLKRSACAKIFHVDDVNSRIRKAVEKCFVQEATLLSRLCHPNTVQIYDFGYLRSSPDGVPEGPFQISELLPQGPLADLVKKRIGLRPRDVLSIVLPISRALAEVHGIGVAHLDVKPRNILLLRTRTELIPKLADFGIAQNFTGRPAEGGQLMYSINWASPEQLVGDAVGPYSDVYALALVAVFALTGRLIFTEGEVAAAYRARKQAAQHLNGMLEEVGLPRAAISVLQQACNFEPAGRMNDVLELGRRLETELSSFDPMPVAPRGRVEEGLPDGAGAAAPMATSPANRLRGASFSLLSLRQPAVVVAGRQVLWCELDREGDLSPQGDLRIRLSYVPSSAERPMLQIRGLNCFVSAGGRRPSAAVTLDASTPIELVSPRGEVLARAEVAFATAGPARTVVTVADHCLVVPSAGCRELVALDFGRGGLCALFYQDRTAA